jgi:apolipoprotein N-acyltransferase
MDRNTWRLGLLGAASMTLVQPPVDLWMAAWAAPVPWILLAASPERAGERRIWPLWIAGFLHWLAAIHWLRLPHPATGIGWVILSAFLGLFVPAFVVATRRLVHRWGVPLVAAAPIAWMGLEQARGSLLGGFTMAAVGHTQWRWTTIIQVADLFGDVGMSGLVVLVAAGIAEAIPDGWNPGGGRRTAWRRCRPLAISALAVVAAAGYGSWRLATVPPSDRRPLEVLLVQGSIDTELKHDPAAAEDVARHYDAVTLEGLSPPGQPSIDRTAPDLVVWPETMWRWGLLEIDPAEELPEDVVAEAVGPPAEADDSPSGRARRQQACREKLVSQRLEAVGAFARRYGTAWLVGLDRQVVTPAAASGARNFNSALFLDAEGRPLGRYDKMYPVLFGECVPFGERFPWLYRLTPLPAGLAAGSRPLAVEIAGWNVAPTICFESTLPGAVRTMVRRLDAEGMHPDVIVNLTNDGWFWGSSELDMHLACGIFRAVEVRTPFVIAANTGFSASIDGSGRLLARGPRRATAAIRARVVRDGRMSPFLVLGAAPTGGCLAAVLFVLAERWRSHRSGGLGSLGGGRLELPWKRGSR